MAPFKSTVTTKETDTDAAGKTSTKEIVATTLPSTTNQYEHAAWSVDGGGSQTILSLQPAGVSALYLAIYRVSNDETSSAVVVQTDNAKITLAPGTSVDISSLNIAVVSQGTRAAGSYQNLCCSLAQQAVQPPKAAGTPGGGGGGAGGGGGNGGGNGGGGNGGGGNGGGGKGGGPDSGFGQTGFPPAGGGGAAAGGADSGFGQTSFPA